MINSPSILTDVTKCIGCEECVGACKKINGLPAEDFSTTAGGNPRRPFRRPLDDHNQEARQPFRA